MKALLSILFVFCMAGAAGQAITPPGGAGSATALNLWNGAVKAKVIVTGTDTGQVRALWMKFSPHTCDTGSIVVQNGYLFYYTGANWVTPASGGGVQYGDSGAIYITPHYFATHNTPVDSSRYATVYRNDTGNKSLRTAIIDTAIALRSAGYIITESDPVFIASTAFSIALTDVSHWNQAYNKYLISGNYAAGTLTFTARDGSTWAVPGLPVGTVTKDSAGFGLTGGVNTSAGYKAVDSNLIPTRLRLQKSLDSINAVLATKGSGTVTKDSAGFGLLGGNVTTNGYKAIDSALITTKLRLQKVIDSIGAIIATKGSGSVTSITATAPLTGGTITTAGSIGLGTAGTAGTYGSGSAVPVITTDAYGRVTNVTTATATVSSANVTAGSSKISLSGTPAGASLQPFSVDVAENNLTISNMGGTLATTHGGTGLTSYALGDIIYGSGTNTIAKLAGNTTATNKFLTQTGTGTTSGVPVWATITSTDLPTAGTAGTYGSSTQVPVYTTDAYGRVISTTNTAIAFPTALPPNGPAGGDLTGTYPNPTIGTNSVTYAKMQSVSATAKLLGSSSTTSAVQEITPGTGLSISGSSLNYSDPAADQGTSTTSYTTSVTITSTIASTRSTVYYDITAQSGNLLFNNPTGSWANFQRLFIRIKGTGSTAPSLTYGTNFNAGTTIPLISATTASKTTLMGFIYNGNTGKWDLVATIIDL